MLDITFDNSGHLKYPKNDDTFNYTYAINSFDYPTMHSHVDYWEFCILIEGSIKNFTLGKGSETYGEKTLSFMTSHDQHAFLKLTDTVRYINLPVRESHLCRILDTISPDFQQRLLEGPRCFPISDTLISQVETLIYQCNLLEDDQILQKNGLLCSAILLVLQELNRIHLHVHNTMSPFMKKLFSLTENREFIRYSVSDLYRALNYSPAHLNRLFNDHFHMTPHAYLQSQKFRYAKNMLQNTDIGIQEIAAEIGYANLSHFFSNFKRLYGVTPGECRRGNASGK